MALLREAVGHTLRDARTSQSRTLRDVARQARVSLGYLSEVERGQKEASSELLLALFNSSTTAFVAFSIPRRIAIGLAPAVTFFIPSSIIA